MAEIKKINVDGVDYDIVGKELTKITYAELKALRDNGELLEGHLYRITDYVTTTVQSGTKSAGNVFDVIVLPVSASELSHIARAIQHEGDTYFDGNDLGAWKLWYDLDNDTEKYEWADATNGKGVIYRMIDEKRNDCPYDFKNILFYNGEFTTSTTSDKYYFTFSYVVNGKLYDGTVEKQITGCCANSMGVSVMGKKKSLNGNVFRNTSFDAHCQSNTFDSGCRHNTFGNYCLGNTFGFGCQSNTLSGDCRHNTFGNDCQINTFDSGCSHNTFGGLSLSNTLRSNCSRNIFSTECINNILGSGCRYNTFGQWCSNNTLGDECEYNTLGTSCQYRSINRERKKTSITLNDEYYDDGSGQLVPIKHPDLSTQPSILPYKFMGQYVYEQLIPMDADWLAELNSSSEKILRTEALHLADVKRLIFLEAKIFAYNYEDMENYSTGETALAVLPVCMPVSIDLPVRYGVFQPDLYEIRVNWKPIHFGTEYNRIGRGYLHIVYTSMPEEEGYYGYNTY